MQNDHKFFVFVTWELANPDTADVQGAFTFWAECSDYVSKTWGQGDPNAMGFYSFSSKEKAEAYIAEYPNILGRFKIDARNLSIHGPFEAAAYHEQSVLTRSPFIST